MENTELKIDWDNGLFYKFCIEKGEDAETIIKEELVDLEKESIENNNRPYFCFVTDKNLNVSYILSNKNKIKK